MYNRLDNKNLSDETSTAESKTETSELSSTAISADGYGSTSVEDEPVPRWHVPWCGLVFYVMGFFGFFCALLVREGLSVAIVAMVNQTAVAEDVAVTNVSEDQCPRDPELIHEDGEFIWDRHQQGVVLAAFYYGYGVLQVSIILTDKKNGLWRGDPWYLKFWAKLTLLERKRRFPINIRS